MKVRWTRPAAEDFERIIEYIKIRDPQVAAFISDSMFECTRRISEFPNIGVARRESGVRELIHPSGRFIIAYIVLTNEIHVLRILHTSQEWPDEF